MFANYSQWSVRSKLALLVMVAGLALFLLGAGGATSLAQQRDAAARALDTQSAVMRAVVGMQNANVQFKTQSQEFKNILLRGYSRDEFDRYVRQFDEAGKGLRAELEKSQGELAKLGVVGNEIPALLGELDTLNKELHLALGSFDLNDPLSGQKVDKLVPGRFRKPTTEMNALVAKSEKLATQSAREAVQALDTD